MRRPNGKPAESPEVPLTIAPRMQLTVAAPPESGIRIDYPGKLSVRSMLGKLGGDWCRGDWAGSPWGLLPRAPTDPDMPLSLPRWDRWVLDRSWDGLFHPFPEFASDGGLPRVSVGSAPTLNFSRPARRSLTLRPA